MNLISRTHYSCEMREYAFMVLREYTIISPFTIVQFSNLFIYLFIFWWIRNFIEKKKKTVYKALLDSSKIMEEKPAELLPISKRPKNYKLDLLILLNYYFWTLFLYLVELFLFLNFALNWFFYYFLVSKVLPQPKKKKLIYFDSLFSGFTWNLKGSK